MINSQSPSPQLLALSPHVVYLAQTDTTVGFLSQSQQSLKKIKPRNNKPFLITTTHFSTLQKLTRIPKQFRKKVRRAKKTTFVYPNNKAIRVIKNSPHTNFLKNFDFLYSTSANKPNQKFDKKWAKEVADIIVEDKRGLFETTSSSIIKLSSKKQKKLR